MCFQLQHSPQEGEFNIRHKFNPTTLCCTKKKVSPSGKTVLLFRHEP